MSASIEGIVVDGPVRDTAALREMGCAVWSTIISPSHPEKRGPGAVNIPVVCDGVRIMPGDIIVADDDAVLVLPVALAPEAVRLARKRNEAEADIRRQIRSGRSLFEILSMQKTLDAAGVRVVDEEWSAGNG